MKECTRCLLNEKVPEIDFDVQGVCNYCYLHDSLSDRFPLNEEGQSELRKMIEKIKENGKGKEYDAIAGVSGGVDSSYLLHMSKKWGLRVLAVHVDNGWNSEISVKNLKAVLTKLNIDLITLVLPWDKFKRILRAFLRAGFSWADAPTDIAIQKTLYKVAAKEGVKYILIGADFRAEGRQPTAWTHCDGRMVKHIVRKFENINLSSYPNLSFSNLLYYSLFRGIKRVTPFYFMKYDKNEAKKELKEIYQWEDYGGHHHESIFTRYIVAGWLIKKFGVDKRMITYSAWVRSGYITREEGFRKLQEPPCSPEIIESDIKYIKKKLDLSDEEFAKILSGPERWPKDFPSYIKLYEIIAPIASLLSKFIFPTKPMYLFGLVKFNETKK